MTVVRPALKRIGWNAVWLVAGCALIAAAGEAWLRATTPFARSHGPMRFVPGVGLLNKPHAQVRYTNRQDFWTRSRTNRLGFLDREPPDVERAAESCHVAVIGDSFVEAREVPIVDKMQVRLEELAARGLPGLDLTTSAYGFSGMGQVNQLPLYDEYARRLRPKLVVLVFHINDYVDNFGSLRALRVGYHPERYLWVAAIRDRSGTIGLRPAAADYAAHRLPIDPWKEQWGIPLETFGFSRGLYLGDMPSRLLDKAAEGSYFVFWLKRSGLHTRRMRIEYFESIMHDYDHWVEDWSWLHDVPNKGIDFVFQHAELPPVLERGLDYTAFGLDQFKQRAERDSFRLVILTTQHVGAKGDPSFDRIHGMAEARGIPVIAQYDHIIRRGGRIEDATWANDHHWTAAGHRWAAEAVLEWIGRNRDVCRPRSGAPGDGP